MKYWAFKHKPGKDAKGESSEYVLQAIRNNYCCMQYEYDIQDNKMVTQNWNRMLEIHEGDVIFLRGNEKIYAYGYAIRPRLKPDAILKAAEIIKTKSHGYHNKFQSCNYEGIIHFDDYDSPHVFYENLDGEQNWGQRIDVDSWHCYYEEGIYAKDKSLYKDGENEYVVAKELKPESAQQFINELYKQLGMSGDILTLLKNNKNVILTGAPGTGKTYLAKQIARLMLFGKKKEEELSEVEQKQFNEQVGFVQFHPSYDYTDFVEGLRPIKDKNGNVGFERKDGIFKEFCKKALKDYSKEKYVFIIDEINRGEISKIFGELFFSIDPGYRGENGRVQTQYQNIVVVGDIFKKGFFIPENVYIIGTMNDIDRSVESMDFAFRRRFAFKEVSAEESKDMLDSEEAWGKDGNEKSLKPNDETIKIIKGKMDTINNLIWHKPIEDESVDVKSIDGLSSAYHIGASYFLKLTNYKKDDGSYDFDKLWKYHLEGLLREYLRGMQNVDDKIEILYNAYKNSKVKDNTQQIETSNDNSTANN